MIRIRSNRTFLSLISGNRANIVRPGMNLKENGIMMSELKKISLVVYGSNILGIVSFATAEGSKIEISGETLSVILMERI